MNRSSRLLALTAALFVAPCVSAQELTFRHFAGSGGGLGAEDGPVALATLNSPSGVTIDTLAHSSSAARSRTTSLSARIPTLLAAAATTEALCGIRFGSGPPLTRGQKYANCLSAAPWKVIA